MKNGIQPVLREMSYQAIEYLVKVVEEDPRFTYAWIYLSAAYFNTRNLDKAYYAYDTVLNLGPSVNMPNQRFDILRMGVI